MVADAPLAVGASPPTTAPGDLFVRHFTGSGVAQALLDATGRFLVVNDALVRRCGRPAAELVGAPLTAVLAAAHHDAVGELLVALRDGGAEEVCRPVDVEHGGGTPDDAVLVLTSLRDLDGRLDGVSAHLLDAARGTTWLRRAARWRALVERAGDLGVVLDGSGVIVDATPAPVLGYSARDLVGRARWEFFHPDDLARARQAFAAAVDAREPLPALEIRVRHADGSWRWVEQRIANLLDDPAVGGVVVNVRDVTARREAERALAASERRHRTIVETADEGVCVVDPAGRVGYANGRLAAMLGRAVADVVGRSLADLADAADAALLRTRLQHPARVPQRRIEVRLRHADGGTVFAALATTPLPDDGETLVMVRDDTELRRQQDDLRRQALHDPLTSLPNRRALLDRIALEQADPPGRLLALFLLELGDLGVVNRAYGARTGDLLLEEVGRRLSALALSGDCLARVGGDEFALLTTAVSDRTEARRLAADVVAELSRPYQVDGRLLPVAATVGVALERGRDAEELLRRATTALAAAREHGPGEVHVYVDDGQDTGVALWQLAGDLRRALAGNELHLVYQPVHDLRTGALEGAEALLRWNSPVHGAVPAPVLVDVAERSGLITDLGAWVLSRACAEAADWPADADAHRPALAVNLSAHQFGDERLADLVETALADTGLAADRLVLEVTESAVMRDPDAAVALMQRLREVGVRFAMDDFGTGYSSLVYVKHFPLEVLKIDRSFVAGLGASPQDTAIVASIVSLARAIGVSVVAEGVETQAQLGALRQLGCDLGQGDLWSAPVDPGRLRELLAGAALARSGGAGLRRRRPGRTIEATPQALARILELHQAGASLATIAAALNREGVPTTTGRLWHRTTVAEVITAALYPTVSLPGQ